MRNSFHLPLILIAFLWLCAPLLPAQKADGRIPKVADADKICFTMYTVSRGVMKMSAHLYPLNAKDEDFVRLEIREDGKWKEMARAKVEKPGWTAVFRVENWQEDADHAYRVVHQNRAFYEGMIRRNPRDKQEFIVAAFTCNSVNTRYGGDIPRQDIVDNIEALDPDLIFFSGDQVYDHKQHYRYWMKFGRDFGQIMRNRPTVCIPDDHDVGNPNLWGMEGKKSHSLFGADGGYRQKAEYVKMVERAQTGHLPDPYAPDTLQRGITTYYTELNWGGMSFAILEDRKWKSSPRSLGLSGGVRPDILTDGNYDPAALDVEGAQLLGQAQLDFLRHWTQDWTDAEFKVVLHQSIFAGVTHYAAWGSNRIYADFDANGWPQSGRNAALAEIRKGFGFMISGDQHLGVACQLGIDDWRDAGWAFCVPAIANFYLRWWAPDSAGANRREGAPEYTGNFLDGFSNMLSMEAVANPPREKTDDKLNTRAAGFGIVRFDKEARSITMECWPRETDITGPEGQYPGWPITIAQTDNYSRQPAGWLPELQIDLPDQVVQVVQESNGEVLYTLRIKGHTFRPGVFEEGSYTVTVGEGKKQLTFRGIKAVNREHSGELRVLLGSE